MPKKYITVASGGVPKISRDNPPPTEFETIFGPPGRKPKPEHDYGQVTKLSYWFQALHDNSEEPVPRGYRKQELSDALFGVIVRMTALKNASRV